MLTFERLRPVGEQMTTIGRLEDPFVWVVGGRGRVGKTWTCWAIAAALRQAKVEYEIWDCDGTAGGGGLHTFFPDAQKCRALPSSDEQLAWLETRLTASVLAPKPILLDLGPDDRLMLRMGAEFPNLLKDMEAAGLPFVAGHVVGPDVEDLRYLERVERDDLFRPDRAVLLKNVGLLSAQTKVAAFAAVDTHPAVAAFVGRGGKVGVLPGLPPELMTMIKANPQRDLNDFILQPENSGPRGFFHAMRIKAFLGEMAALCELILP